MPRTKIITGLQPTLYQVQLKFLYVALAVIVYSPGLKSCREFHEAFTDADNDLVVPPGVTEIQFAYTKPSEEVFNFENGSAGASSIASCASNHYLYQASRAFTRIPNLNPFTTMAYNFWESDTGLMYEDGFGKHQVGRNQSIFFRFNQPQTVVRIAFGTHSVESGPSRFSVFASDAENCLDETQWTVLKVVNDNKRFPGQSYLFGSLKRVINLPVIRPFRCYGIQVRQTPAGCETDPATSKLLKTRGTNKASISGLQMWTMAATTSPPQPEPSDINECASNPCQNSGVCVDGINQYRCYCRDGFEGDRCQIKINECANSPCRNGGVCEDLIGNYKCKCIPGFTRKNCEVNINECQTVARCLHGGTCVDGINSYTCTCLAGYEGENCERESQRVVEFDDTTAVRLTAYPAQFGSVLATPVGGRVVVVNPMTTCGVIHNKFELSGKIAIMRRGDCKFIDKARAVEKHGAIGGIVIDNNPESSAASPSIKAIGGDGTDDVSIPLVLLQYQEGDRLLSALSANPDLIVNMSRVFTDLVQELRGLGFTEELCPDEMLRRALEASGGELFAALTFMFAELKDKNSTLSPNEPPHPTVHHQPIPSSPLIDSKVEEFFRESLGFTEELCPDEMLRRALEASGGEPFAALTFMFAELQGKTSVNWAAATDTKLSTSSNFSANQSAEHALPGATNSPFWLSRSSVPQWFCAEFATPIIIGTVQITPWIQTTTTPHHLQSSAPSKFRIEGSNDNGDWTILYRNERENAPGGVNCIYTLSSHQRFKYCRIYIEMTRDGIGSYAGIHSLIITEKFGVTVGGTELTALASIPIGLRVVRGRHWFNEEQDGGAGSVGVITEVDTDGWPIWVWVTWSSGNSHEYATTSLATAPDNNDCLPNPCLNSGSCTDKLNSFECACAAGYSGSTCAIDNNDCLPNPCLNSGSCTDKVNSFECACAAGYSGSTCAIATSNCKTTENGEDYRGQTDITKSGNTCKTWSEHGSTYYSKYPLAGLTSNYCRNPDSDPGGPWCFTDNGGTNWGYCHVPLCIGVEISSVGIAISGAPSRFRLVQESKTWADAAEYCQNATGNLATFKDLDEYRSVILPLFQMRDTERWIMGMWVGAKGLGRGKGFGQIDGSPFPFNWGLRSGRNPWWVDPVVGGTGRHPTRDGVNDCLVVGVDGFDHEADHALYAGGCTHTRFRDRWFLCEF